MWFFIAKATKSLGVKLYGVKLFRSQQSGVYFWYSILYNPKKSNFKPSDYDF